MTTNAAWLTAIQGLSITGVNELTTPPESIDTTNLPIGFPNLPTGGRPELLMSCHGNNKARSIQYIVIVEATGQDTIANNYGQLAALMDNIETELDGLVPGTVNFIEYEATTSGNFPVGESEYWAIVYDITGTDAR